MRVREDGKVEEVNERCGRWWWEMVVACGKWKERGEESCRMSYGGGEKQR